MSKKISVSVFIFVLLAAMLVTFMTAFTVTSAMYRQSVADAYHQGTGDTPSISGDSSKLDILVALMKQYSYYDIDEETFCKCLLDGVPYAVGDKYAFYYNEEELEELRAENVGDTEGIGITVIENGDLACIEVISVLPDSPAAAAGLLPGDLIVYIGVGDNVTPISEYGYNGAVNKLRGPAGTQAEFTVNRNGEMLEFRITRAHVTSQSVTWHFCDTDKTVGIIRISQFDLTTPVQFAEGMDALIAGGATDFIFDVRYNPGGDLASITAVLSFMLNEGDVVIRTKDRAGNTETTTVKTVNYPAGSDYYACNVAKKDIGKYRKAVEGHSAVLANNGSASAAELFTCALKDYKISTIVGETTYGKGSMQSILDLSYYGTTGALKMTTRMYFPPLSEGYDGIGITPDVAVELNESQQQINFYKIEDKNDNQLQEAIRAVRSR